MSYLVMILLADRTAAMHANWGPIQWLDSLPEIKQGSIRKVIPTRESSICPLRVPSPLVELPIIGP